MSNITSKDQQASQSCSGPHSTHNSELPQYNEAQWSLLSQRSLVELDSCLHWSWKALAIPSLT